MRIAWVVVVVSCVLGCGAASPRTPRESSAETDRGKAERRRADEQRRADAQRREEALRANEERRRIEREQRRVIK